MTERLHFTSLYSIISTLSCKNNYICTYVYVLVYVWNRIFSYFIPTDHFVHALECGYPTFRITVSLEQHRSELHGWSYTWVLKNSKYYSTTCSMGFPGGSAGKESTCNAGDLGSIPGSGRFPGEGNGNPLQYSCLENPMDGGAWWAPVHGVTKSRWTRMSNFTFTCSMVDWISSCGILDTEELDHVYGGLTISYLQIFDCVEVSAPNPCVVQGSIVLLY